MRESRYVAINTVSNKKIKTIQFTVKRERPFAYCEPTPFTMFGSFVNLIDVNDSMKAGSSSLVMWAKTHQVGGLPATTFMQ